MTKMTKRLTVRWRGGVPVRAYYEAARYDGQRKQRKETASGSVAAIGSAQSLRDQARHLDENHDLAAGALNTLVQNIVGQNGIGVEPQPRTNDGSIHDDFAWSIEKLWREWQLFPEVTGQFDWASAQRIACRTWLRDGEALSQSLQGSVPYLDHGTVVPYSIELIEPDFLPLDLNSIGASKIVGGIEVSAWNRPLAYHLYREHPADYYAIASAGSTKRVTADRISHLKLITRIGQLRGVSLFASVMLRLDDIKDYEESERIAAKVAASMAAYIRKGDASMYEQEEDDDGESLPRQLRFRPGMVFDDLLPGEEIGTIDTSRPNPQLEPHRNGQLRAAAAGLRTTYSSLSKDYGGTYSAQRQELVEGFGAYGVLASDFIGQFVRPHYLRFLETAISSGQLILPKSVDPISLADAYYQPPQMPWIDPMKEAVAWGTLEENGHASGIEIIRRRGQNPRDVADQQKRWCKMRGEQNADPANPAAASKRMNALALDLLKPGNSDA